jgi:hypothetical protein
MLQIMHKGAAANDKSGTPARQAADIINGNFEYLESKIGKVIPYYVLQFVAKGSGNTENPNTEEPGDIFEGWKDATTYWPRARWNGGDRNDRNNYTPLCDPKPDPVLFYAPTTGSNQAFELPPDFKAGSVLKSRGELFKGSEWTQTDNILTVIVNTNLNNTIYVKHE